MSGPLVSVVIATRNRADLLRRCLERLDRQTQDWHDFEVVVADDGSTDETAEVCAWASAFLTLRHLPAPWGGQAVALNRGIAAAAGRYCLLLDDDIEVEPQFVAAHVRAQISVAVASASGARRSGQSPTWTGSPADTRSHGSRATAP